MLKSLFNEVAGHQACNFIKKRLQHKCFPVKYVKLFRIFCRISANGCFRICYGVVLDALIDHKFQSLQEGLKGSECKSLTCKAVTLPTRSYDIVYRRFVVQTLLCWLSNSSSINIWSSTTSQNTTWFFLQNSLSVFVRVIDITTALSFENNSNSIKTFSRTLFPEHIFVKYFNFLYIVSLMLLFFLFIS